MCVCVCVESEKRASIPMMKTHNTCIASKKNIHVPCHSFLIWSVFFHHLSKIFAAWDTHILGVSIILYM